jgi:hypothetical protein
VDVTGTPASTTDKGAITFWYGCNVLRHADLIRGCIDIMEALGFQVFPAGGPGFCCGTIKDANQTAAAGMASRTASRFNAMNRDRVIAWCPSCLSHMTEFTQNAYETDFALTFVTDLLYEHREALAKLIRVPVPMRVMVHKHAGFNDKSKVNQKVPELLKLIPGIEIVEDGYVAPGYMCALLSSVPQAMSDMFANTRSALEATRADAVVTIFHQCYREICGLEAEGGVKAFNYIHLLARAMGMERQDEYKAWKMAGEKAGDLVGETRLEKVGVDFFKRAILPELNSRPKYARTGAASKNEPGQA